MKRLIILIFVFVFVFSSGFSQSFNEDKTSAINYIKRVYDLSPFEGVKTIKADNIVYYAVAVSFLNIIKDSLLTFESKALRKAELLAEQGFSEPCINFEMINHIENGNRQTFLFFCNSLSQFITDVLQQKLFNGVRIITSPSNNYIISSVTLDNVKYSPSELRDKVAGLKARQFVNTMVNGSTITSDQIIRIDESDNRSEVSSTEVVREYSMGFIQGLQLLFSKEITLNKTTYVYFAKF